MTATERVRRRLGRLRPSHLPAPVRAWAIGCWIASAALVALLLIPGIADSVSAQGSGVIATFAAPAGFRIAGLVAASITAGAAVVWVLIGDRRVLREAVLAAASLAPLLLAAADRQALPSLVAGIVGVTTLILAHLPAARRGFRMPAGLGLLAAVPWLVLVPFQLTAVGSSPRSWVWVTLFGVAAAVGAFGSYYGVARAAESRSARLTFLYRADLHPAVVLGIVLACALVVSLRLTVARELFPAPDPELWTPFDNSVASWAIAVAVALLIVIVAVRASARPLARFGERRVVAGLAGLGNLELLASMLVILLGLGVAVITGVVFLPTGWITYIAWGKFAGVVLLLILVLLPPFRGTAARWVGVSSAIFLASTTLTSAFAASGIRTAGFAATPVQVLLVLVIAAFSLAIWNAVNPAGRVNPGLVARIAVVPLIAVHAGWLLPAAWSELGRVVLVLGILLALFWLMPPVAADPARHARTVLGASLGQLVGLLVFVLALPSLFSDGALTVLGLLWLAIPVIAALTIDTTPDQYSSFSPVVGTRWRTQ